MIDLRTEELMLEFGISCGSLQMRVDPEARLLTREAHAEVAEAMASLPPRDSLLVELHNDELPWKDVAERLGIPERTAKDHYAKIRERLRKALQRRDLKGT